MVVTHGLRAAGYVTPLLLACFIGGLLLAPAARRLGATPLGCARGCQEAYLTHKCTSGFYHQWEIQNCFECAGTYNGTGNNGNNECTNVANTFCTPSANTTRFKSSQTGTTACACGTLTYVEAATITNPSDWADPTTLWLCQAVFVPGGEG